MSKNLYIKHTIDWIDFINTWRPRQNCRHFADDIFKCIIVNKNASISIKVSLKFVLRVQLTIHIGAKPFSEPITVSSLRNICVTRPQWVKHTMDLIYFTNGFNSWRKCVNMLPPFKSWHGLVVVNHRIKWFVMIYAYTQLNNLYGELICDILNKTT